MADGDRAGAPAVTGSQKADARRLSTFAVSAVEGALILARVEGSGEPIEDVARSLALVLQKQAPLRKRAAR